MQSNLIDNPIGYFMIITNEFDYECDVKNNFKFIGFPTRNRISVQKMKIGDKVLFYVTKHSKFVAAVEIVGTYFYSNDRVWTDYYDLWPHRIKTTPLVFFDKVENGIYIKDIWDDLGFIKNKGKWGSQVQGSFRNITEADFHVILRSLERKTK